jgi:cellobiose-specific phosphotransferase system component IIB
VTTEETYDTTEKILRKKGVSTKIIQSVIYGYVQGMIVKADENNSAVTIQQLLNEKGDSVGRVMTGACGTWSERPTG